MVAIVSFDVFVAAHRRDLTRFAAVLTGKPWLADDLVADVLSRAWERWATVSAAHDVKSYVRKMIVNEYLSWRRRASRSVPVDEFADSIHVGSDGAQDRADHDQLFSQVQSLPRKQRTVVVLRFYCDLPHDEIAQLMDCNVSTVRGYLSRALRTLRIAGGDQPAHHDDAISLTRG